MGKSLITRLSFMMFLEYFIWGVWFVTMGAYLLQPKEFGGLGASGIQVGLAFGTQSVGAIVAPFLVGIIADKYFSGQKIFGILHLLGGVLLWFASGAETFERFYTFIILYMVIYMPTLPLANTISMRQMNDTEKEFPLIRTFGTIGWIISGLIIMIYNWELNNTLNMTFKLASVVSIFLGIYSFTLPSTLPLKKGISTNWKVILGFDALELLKDRNFLIFFLSSIAICIPTGFYYAFANPFLNDVGMTGTAGKMTIGQFFEVIFLLLLPFFFKKLGVKRILSFGMLFWAIRYFFFAFGYENGPNSALWILLYLGIAVHGICYDYFFISGQIYTDNKAGKNFQTAAQGLIALGTYGIGLLLGSLAAGYTAEYYTDEFGKIMWKNLWIVPAVFSLFVLVFFNVFFHEET